MVTSTVHTENAERMVKQMIEFLIELLKQTLDKTKKAILLQSYVQQLGPIPDEYAAVVRGLLKDGESDE